GSTHSTQRARCLSTCPVSRLTATSHFSFTRLMCCHAALLETDSLPLVFVAVRVRRVGVGQRGQGEKGPHQVAEINRLDTGRPIRGAFCGFRAFITLGASQNARRKEYGSRRTLPGFWNSNGHFRPSRAS